MLLRLKKELNIYGNINLPIGTMMTEEQWCDVVGRTGGINLRLGSDKDWWELPTFRVEDGKVVQHEKLNKETTNMINDDSHPDHQ